MSIENWYSFSTLPTLSTHPTLLHQDVFQQRLSPLICSVMLIISRESTKEWTLSSYYKKMKKCSFRKLLSM